jgi:hypothetical protein
MPCTCTALLSASAWARLQLFAILRVYSDTPDLRFHLFLGKLPWTSPRTSSPVGSPPLPRYARLSLSLVEFVSMRSRRVDEAPRGHFVSFRGARVYIVTRWERATVIKAIE